jgi:hypothetical protein
LDALFRVSQALRGCRKNTHSTLLSEACGNR